MRERDAAERLCTIAQAAGLPAELVDGLTPADLRDCADEPDAALLAFLRACQRTKQMAGGRCPESYTQASHCAGCGPVWLWEGAPREALACPWCWHRIAGVTLPRPRVTCATCALYLPDPLNPLAGVGRCADGYQKTQRTPTYALIERHCLHWRNNQAA